VIYKVVDIFYRSMMVSNEKYKLIYKPGSIVRALPGTLGIMAFDDINRAMQLAYYWNYSYNGSKILSAEPIGPITRPIYICKYVSETTLDIYYEMSSGSYEMLAPRGTVCCPSIRVIKEIDLTEGGKKHVCL